MKKSFLLLFFVVITLQSSFAWWTCLYNRGTPWKTYYLGDKQSDVFEFAVNQATDLMTVSYGIGKASNGSDWTWHYAEWSWLDGSNNRVWKSKANEQQFTSTGTWYYAGRFVWTSDSYTEYASGDWAENRTSITGSSYFTVVDLINPSSLAVTSTSSSTVSLSWSKDNPGRNVIIIRKKSTDSWTEPTQGTGYSVNNTIGSGTVVYSGTGGTFTDTGLNPGTSYDYKFYAENYSYYSSGATINTSTATSSASDYFRSKNSGNWSVASNWESSPNNSIWVTSSLAPGTSATAVTILSSHTVAIDANTTVTLLTINAGGKLTVNNGITLSTTTFNINSNSTETGTFVDNGTVSATTTNVQQNLASARNWYMTSPVTGNLPAGYTYYKYDEPGNNPASPLIAPETLYWEKISSGTATTTAKGYIVQAASASTITFAGAALNTGDKSIGLTRTAGKTKEGFNLVGNPYPSFLSISNLSSNTDIVPTYWYRSYNGGYVYDTYNIPSTVSTGNSGLIISNYIPPMQAFWVRVVSGKSTGTLNLLNANRGHQDNANNKFRAPASKNTNQQLLRLQVSNGTNSDETVVYFNASASNDYDQYDSPKMTNDNPAIPEIYTKAGTEQLVINGMNSLPLNTEIPLGFTPGQSGSSLTIKASELVNFDSDTQVILIDNQNPTPAQDLTGGTAYTFSTDATPTESRFSIIFKSKSGTTNLSTDNENQSVAVYKDAGNRISVKCNPDLNNVNLITIYSALGQKLVSKTVSGAVTVIDKPLGSGVYMVTVTINGKNITKKIILD